MTVTKKSPEQATELHGEDAFLEKEKRADKVNILVVDDREDKLLALEATLAELNQNIVKARSGRDALRQILQKDFAVILLDVNMPDMDGYETAGLIRQRTRSEFTPIIFVTSVSQAENDVFRGYSLGAVDYILSPIIPEILRTKVSVFIELYKRTEEVRQQSDRLRHMEETFHKKQLVEAQTRLDVETKRNRFFTLAIDMLAIANFDGYFLQLNPTWQKVLGFSETELKAKPLVEFVRPDDREDTAEQLSKLKEEENRTIYFENRCPHKDGSFRWLGWMAATFAAEKLIYIFARDITEQKHRVEELTEVNDELQAFSYSISHDLRAPLRSIAGFALSLWEESGANLTESSKDYVHRIIQSSKYMERLLQDLLEYSRLARTELKLSTVNLEQTVDEVLQLLKNDLEDKKAEVEVVRPLTPVLAHQPTLRQTLTNLIENALKFVPSDRTPHVRIRTETEHGSARIWIEDNGIGIASEYRGKIFNLFERLHPAAEYPGTGVGLALVRKGVERMRGTVGLESKVNVGSRFWITLPLAQVETK